MNETGTTKNPYLYNRQGQTPWDEPDSLDLLEIELQEEIKKEERKLSGQGPNSTC